MRLRRQFLQSKASLESRDKTGFVYSNSFEDLSLREQQNFLASLPVTKSLDQEIPQVTIQFLWGQAR